MDNGTKGRVRPESVLAGAAEANLKDVFVIGIDANGKPYRASTTGYAPKLFDMLEQAKRDIRIKTET